MAQIQSKRDDNSLRSARDQHTWDGLEKLVKKKLPNTSNEFRCDCPSCSDIETVRKKVFTKNLSKRSGTLSRNRKNNKFTTTTQSRRKLRTEYDHSYQDVVGTSLCDKPRVLEKSIKTKNTIKSLGTTEVKSVEVVKNYPKNCCSALYRESKIISTRKSDKLKSSRDKKSSELSSLSLLSPVSSSFSLTTDISSIDDESNNQRTKKREKKSKKFRNGNSSENDFKHLNEQTYQRTARGNRSPETSYKSQGLSPRDFENRETTHKVKNHQMGKLPHESPYKNSKLDRILQIHETQGLATCTCDESIDDNCTVLYNCPEKIIHQDDVKNRSLSGEYYQRNEKSSSSFKDDNYAMVEELIIPSKKSDKSSFSKSYSPSMNLEAKPPKRWQKLGQNLENISANYREISSGLKKMRREIAETEKPNSREKITQEYPIRKFMFERQSVGDDFDTIKSINKPSKKNIVDESYSTSSLSSQKITPKVLDREKSSPHSGQEKIDPIDDVVKLTDQLIINNQDITSPNRLGVSLENCRFEFCKCDLLDHEENLTGKSTSPLVNNVSVSREPSRERIKRHAFFLPKIVVPESSERSDIRKMFVYPPEENREPPLTVYRTSSFVKCEIRKNKNIGFRYVLTYVQKYVSPTWKPDEQNKSKATSQEHVKTDDYG